ncbi:MAG: LacI family transcriptional regulator [Acidobacteriota bacterium]|nr:LacI family transcriptional regulator [Acidobacteriota bacterium]
MRTSSRSGRNVTIRDVAKESKVSATTVSIVLNDSPLARYIPAVTKTRIHKVAKKLGYRPNLFARSLRSNRSNTVGLMVFDITDPYCTLILRGVQSALYSASYTPILSDVQNERARFERYLEMLLARRIEGLIVLANWLFMDITLLADLENDKVPCVVIGRELDHGAVSSVIVDNELGGFLALEHLYALGHRKVAFIRGPKALGDSSARWRGARKFAQLRGLDINPKLTFELPDSRDPWSGFEAAYKLTLDLTKHKRWFSAVMAFDDMSALGVMRALAHAGISVPSECSVIGFDDIAPAALCTPPLTTIRQPMEVMGALAVGIMLENLQAIPREFAAVHRKVAPELVVRESTAPLGPRSEEV